MRTTLSLQAWTVGWQVVQERNQGQVNEHLWKVTDREEPVDSLEECPMVLVWGSLEHSEETGLERERLGVVSSETDVGPWL